MKNNQTIRLGRNGRKGALTLELVLIFPILMLLFFLFFQVSVMLLTYHSLQTIASHAALRATTATSVAEITAVVNAGVKDWYYASDSDLEPANSGNWEAGNLRFRILRQNGTSWEYVGSGSELPVTGTNMMIEIRLTSSRFGFTSQFKGVNGEGASSFYVSAMGRRM